MKKTLIALAALAVSGASMAQVTLYGVVDVAIGSANYSGAPSSVTGTQMVGNGSAVTNSVNDGNSRWGFKVVEDLGGGMKFTGQFEQNINYEDGSTVTANSRYAYGQLSGNFGALKYGRTLSPSFFGVAAWELTGAANFSAVANQFGFAGAGSRNSSEMSYTTPSMGGFTATLGYVTEQDGIAQGYGGSKVDANAIYAAGPLSVGLSYWKLDKPAVALNNVNASTDGNYALGASYNFGSFILAGSFQDPAGSSQGWTLGGSVPVGAWKFTADVAQDTGFDKTDYLLYAGYSLSKRTTVYFDYRRDGKSGKTGTLADGTIGFKRTLNVDVDAYGLGIRHNF
jgi:predicted porin